MKNYLSIYISENKSVIAALIVILIYLSPNIFFPHEARFLVHDNLDSNVVWYKNLAESGKMFASNDVIIPNSLGGIPRGCYPAEYNLLHLFYLWFSPLFAYNLNIILTHLLALFSMYILLRKHVFKFEFKSASLSVALLFALLPFWPSGGLTIALQPLLLYAFLNILCKDYHWKNWLIISLIPFCTVLVHSNFFFLIILCLVALGRFIKQKRINFYFILSVILYLLISILLEYRLFKMQFIDHFESHRSLKPTESLLNFKGVIGISFMHFLKGQYHFLSLQFPFIILFSIAALVLNKEKKIRLIIAGLLSGIYFISLLYVLPDWGAMKEYMTKYPLLKVVSLRFYSLFPLLWFIVLAYSAKAMFTKNLCMARVAVAVIIIMGLSTIFSLNDKDYYNSEYAENSFYRTYVIKKKTEDYASFDEYYKVDFFKTIKERIHPDTFKVGCIGIDPGILQYNGYYTIDGYFFYFSKDCAQSMNAICKKEHIKSNINGVNSRCLLWSDELQRGKDTLVNLELNYSALKKLNTKYIFSTKKIINDSLRNELVVNKSDDKIFIYSIY